ncbi:MAG: acyl carrier protein [Clostridia bacterium]|nr:acyl carrier protein [Clostridia bacterium]
MVFEKVAQIIAEQLGIEVDGLTPETEFEEIDADSLELVGVIMAVEQEFSIEVDDEDIEKVKTIGDVVDYINNNL